MSLKTAGPAAAVRLAADRPTIQHSTNDLAYITATLVDASGTTVPVPAHPAVLFDIVSGPAEIIAVGSADPQDRSSLRSHSRRFFRGRALAIARPLVSAAAGVVTVTATVQGLPVVICNFTTSTSLE